MSCSPEVAAAAQSRDGTLRASNSSDAQKYRYALSSSAVTAYLGGIRPPGTNQPWALVVKVQGYLYRGKISIWAV